MSRRIRGITIEIGGDTQKLTKALEGVNKHSRDLQSELRQVERLLKLDPKNTELLAQKQKILADSVDNTKKKLETLKEAEKQVQEQFKEGKVGEEQYRAIQREVIRTTQELDKLEKNLQDVNSIWKNISETLDKTGTKMKKIGEEITKKVTLPMAAAGAASFKMGADFEQAMGKMEVVFEENSKVIERWAENSLEDFGLARNTAIQMVGDFGALFKGMGISLHHTEEWSKTLVERTMDLANFYDTTIDETIRALETIVTGQTEPLRRFGINMTQATLQEYAYSKGIRKRIQDMTEAEKVQLRYNFVIEKTNIAVGTTARESDTATGQLNKLRESLKELALSFSEHILPIIVPIIEWLNNMIERFSGLSDEAKKFIVIAGGITATLGPVLVALGSVFKAISNISEGMKAAKTAIDGVKKAGSLISNMLSATGSWGFKEWAVAIAGVVALLTVLVALLDAVFNKGRGMERVVSNIKDVMSGVGVATNQSRRMVNRYVSGSHRHGLDYVPYDNYVAILHEGERVLTKGENQQLSQGNGDTFILNVQMDEVDEVYKLVNVVKQLKQARRAGVIQHG